MSTDEEKVILNKLLQGIETPEIKLPERCSALMKQFHTQFGKEIETEEEQNATHVTYENPYKVDKKLLEENDRKLKELLAESKRLKKQISVSLALTSNDPQRPWRTNSSKEKLLRINNELKEHHEKANDVIQPMNEAAMKDLVKQCAEEGHSAVPVKVEKLNETVSNAKKTLTNFQYKKVQNSTATAIMPEAHEVKVKPETPLKN